MESILFEVKLIDLILDQSPEYSGAYLILVWRKMLYELKSRKKNREKICKFQQQLYFQYLCLIFNINVAPYQIVSLKEMNISIIYIF